MKLPFSGEHFVDVEPYLIDFIKILFHHLKTLPVHILSYFFCMATSFIDHYIEFN